MFAAVANGLNCFVFPCIALSVVLRLVSVFWPGGNGGMDSVVTRGTKTVATRHFHRIRAIVLMPTMIVLGLVLMVYDRLNGRRQALRH